MKDECPENGVHGDDHVYIEKTDHLRVRDIQQTSFSDKTKGGRGYDLKGSIIRLTRMFGERRSAGDLYQLRELHPQTQAWRNP